MPELVVPVGYVLLVEDLRIGKGWVSNGNLFLCVRQQSKTEERGLKWTAERSNERGRTRRLAGAADLREGNRQTEGGGERQVRWFVNAMRLAVRFS